MGLHEVGGKTNFPHVGSHRDGSGIKKIPLKQVENHDFIILVTIFKNTKILSF